MYSLMVSGYLAIFLATSCVFWYLVSISSIASMSYPSFLQSTDIVNFLMVSRSCSFFIRFATVPALTPVFMDISFAAERELLSRRSKIFRSSLSMVFKAFIPSFYKAKMV